MRIFNAIAEGGAIFGAEGNLLYPEWPNEGYLRCPRQPDQELFRFLENARWSNGAICASARWWERREDDPHRGPEFKAGTFGFEGSGIHFHFLDEEMVKSNLHFLCEVPWKDIFDEEDKEFTFVGEERFRKAFLDHIEKQQVICESRLHRLLQELTALSSKFGRLRQATRGSF